MDYLDVFAVSHFLYKYMPNNINIHPKRNEKTDCIIKIDAIKLYPPHIHTI